MSQLGRRSPKLFEPMHNAQNETFLRPIFDPTQRSFTLEELYADITITRNRDGDHYFNNFYFNPMNRRFTPAQLAIIHTPGYRFNPMSLHYTFGELFSIQGHQGNTNQLQRTDSMYSDASSMLQRFGTWYPTIDQQEQFISDFYGFHINIINDE